MTLPFIFWLEDWSVLYQRWDITENNISRSRLWWLYPSLRQGRILFWNSVDAVRSTANTFENLILVSISSSSRMFHVSVWCVGYFFRWVHTEYIEIWALALHLPHLHGSCIDSTLANRHAGPSSNKYASSSRGCVGNERGQAVEKEAVWL